MIRLLFFELIRLANVVASVVIPINVAPNNTALTINPVLVINNTGTTMPKDCNSKATTKHFTNPIFFASEDQIIQDGIAAKPTIIHIKVASPLKFGVCPAIDMIKVPVTIYPRPSSP